MRRANVTFTVTLRSFDVALGNIFILLSGPGWRSQYSDSTGWTVRGSNPGRAIFSAPFQTGPGAHAASYTMGTGLFSRGKPAVRVALSTHLPYSAEIKEGVELYLYAVCAFLEDCSVNFTFYSLLRSFLGLYCKGQSTTAKYS